MKADRNEQLATSRAAAVAYEQLYDAMILQNLGGATTLV